MTIPPHAARLAGAWAAKTSRPTATVDAGQPHRSRRNRTRRITVVRLLHPLHRPVALLRKDAQAPTGTQPARHA